MDSPAAPAAPVRIDSAPGSGTTVRLLLPRAAGEAPVVGDVVAGVMARPSRPLNILLVEDDDGVATVLTELLAGLGHGVQRLAAAGGRSRCCMRARGPTSS
jgi:hypothetical protein